MEAKVAKSWTLSQFKTANGIDAIDVFKSRNTGKLYGCRRDNGEFIGMIADDLNKELPVRVLRMLNEETGETWDFICNGEPREALDTL